MLGALKRSGNILFVREIAKSGSTTQMTGALEMKKIEGRLSFRLEDKTESDRFPQCFVKEVAGSDFNLAYLQRHGFNTPLLFRDKTGLWLRVPSPKFFGS